MSGRTHSLKRRDPDDLLLDLQNVSLSPSKKLRVSEPGVPVVAGPGPIFATPQPTGETPFSLLKGPSAPVLSASTPSTPLCSDTVLSPPPPSPVPVSVPASESKALVLYRPVNPPLFPGGPPFGSVDLPISLRMNSSMLPRPQALDLSGGPSISSGQKRLTRISSCPRFSSVMDDLPMIEEIDDKAAEQLQLIPWVPYPAVTLLTDTKPIIEEFEDGPVMFPDADEMVDAESMEVVGDDIILPEVDTTTMAGQFGNPLQTFTAAPWPQYETLQPQFPKVMWSH